MPKEFIPDQLGASGNIRALNETKNKCKYYFFYKCEHLINNFAGCINLL
jgi:hypothetical protein